MSDESVGVRPLALESWDLLRYKDKLLYNNILGSIPRFLESVLGLGAGRTACLQIWSLLNFKTNELDLKIVDSVTHSS
jgi:hypothetical protein